MTLALIAIGNTGAGKSTIGNIILTGKHDGVFATSNDPTSCTKQTTTKTGTCAGVGVSYTDTPGMPDTDPSNLVSSYDQIVEAIKSQPLSAILFVFEYGKINPALYQKSEIMFREIQKAKCLKVLIINDHGNRLEPLTVEQNLASALKIAKYTRIRFFVDKDYCFVNRSNMRKKVHHLVAKIESVSCVHSPHLQTFTQLKESVHKTKSDAEYLELAKKELEADIASKEQMQRYLTYMKNASAIAIYLCAAGATSVDPYLITSMVLAAKTATVAAIDLQQSAVRKQVKKLKHEQAGKEQQHQEIVKKLKIDEELFKTLCHELDHASSS